ncbi:serine protein kinase RIO [Candidatus Micrarchaeota archaeon]|nr:serine protein kinase RIO [Candidatus Micrarchaeota archaeon]MBD3418398.1 serine protein kinase RIO [Candidatus Micrarchaeota archaeon]
MARKVSKRKRPSKDDFLLKERFKLESEVFDRQTLLALSKLIGKGILSTIDYPVSTGKEANVFRATTPSGSFIAVKIYKIETTHFMRRKEYLEGDPRFKKFRRTERDLVSAFAQKEFKNLQICERAKVHAPQPLLQEKNILLMEFLGEEGYPYSQLNVLGPESISQLKSILLDMRRMYRAGLVHADISEYNILVGPKPYLIDFGQGVVLSHPSAEKYLERDVCNIVNYFAKFGFKMGMEESLEYIKS